MTKIEDALRSLPEDVKQTQFVDDGFITNLVRSGVQVDEGTSMRLGTVFACVRNISQDVAATPLHLYKRSGRKNEKAENHPLYTLLHDAPNPETTSFNFKQALMANLLLWGNGYAYKERNEFGQVIGLWNLRSDMVSPSRNEQGELQYQIGSKTYTRYHILHVPGLGFDGTSGRSCIQYAREPVSIGLAAEELGARFFGSGAHLGGVISVKGELSDTAFDRTKVQFNEMYKGLENATGIPILEGGAVFTNTTIPLKDAQYIESRKFSRNEIAMMFRVPPHKVNDLERATFSNIEEQDLDYYKSALLPWFICVEQACDLQLLKDGDFYEKTQYYFHFNADAILRGSTADRYEAHSLAINAQWLTQNEAREMEGLNPFEGEEYDLPIQPLNMADKGGDPTESELKDKGPEVSPQETDDEPKKRAEVLEGNADGLYDERRMLMSMYEPKVSAMRLRHLGADEKAVLELAKEKSGEELKNAVIEHFGPRYEQVSKDMQEIMQPFSMMVLASAVSETGKGGVSMDNARYAKFVKSYCDRYSKGYLADTKRMVLNAIDAAATEPQRAIHDEETEDEAESIEMSFEEARGGSWPGQKQEQAAKDETNRALGAFLVMAYQLLGVKRKVWVGVGTSCPMCSQLIGRTIEVEKSFTEEGGVLEWTDDLGRVQTMVTHYRSAPPLHKGCDCQVRAAD